MLLFNLVALWYVNTVYRYMLDYTFCVVRTYENSVSSAYLTLLVSYNHRYNFVMHNVNVMSAEYIDAQ